MAMLGANLDWSDYLSRLQQTLAAVDPDAIQQWADVIFEAYENDRCVYFFGNGGSGTTATHMCEDLGKSSLPESALFDEGRRRLRVMSLTDNQGWILAIGNDLGYEHIFSQQLMNFGRPGDVAIGISGSGNSANILRAIDWANRHGLKTVGICGFSGGRLKDLAQHVVHVPSDDMGLVESAHLGLYHWVLDDVFARINRVGRYALPATIRRAA